MNLIHQIKIFLSRIFILVGGMTMIRYLPIYSNQTKVGEAFLIGIITSFCLYSVSDLNNEEHD